MGYFPLYQLLGVSKTTRVWLCWELSNVSFDSAGNWGLGKHWEHILLRKKKMLPKKMPRMKHFKLIWTIFTGADV
jgi:hypothetical protein